MLIFISLQGHRTCSTDESTAAAVEHSQVYTVEEGANRAFGWYQSSKAEETLESTLCSHKESDGARDR